MKYTAKEIILLMLTGMVITILVVPVLSASIGSAIKGEPITRTEFLKTAGDIVIYVLGIISGYVLNKSDKAETPEKTSEKT
jgi:hypothetical protein